MAVLGVESFATTTAGFAELYAWLAGFGVIDVSVWRAPAPLGLGWRAFCAAPG
jgi:hypothetical protein